MSTEPTKKSLTELSPFKWVVASLVGLGSGLAGAVAAVQREFHRNIIKFPEMEEKIQEHKEAIGAIKRDRLAGVIDTENFIRQYKSQKETLANEANKLSETLGIRSMGAGGYIEGSVQRFRTLSHHSQIPVIFGAVAATVIGFAGTSMFFNSLSMHKHMEHLSDALDASKDKQR